MLQSSFTVHLLMTEHNERGSRDRDRIPNQGGKRERADVPLLEWNRQK